MKLLDLPVDIVLAAFRFITVDDVYTLRQVCRQFNILTHLKSAWRIMLGTHIIDEDLPFPYGSPSWINTLSSRELESVVVRALRDRRNWTSESPRPTRRLTMQTSELHSVPSLGQRHIKELKLFSRSSHPFLLSATVNVHADAQTPPSLAIECWDIERSPFCIARQHSPWHGGALFNTNATFPPSVAIKGLQDVQILSFSTVPSSYHSTFTPVAHLPIRADKILTFSGNLVFALESDQHLFLYDVNRPGFRAEVLSPALPSCSSLPSETTNCYESIITDEYLVLLRSRYIAFYALRSFRHGAPPTTATTLAPVVYHVWQWRIDSGRLAHRISHRPSRSIEPPLNLIVRFAGTYNPWPTNVLSHYVLQPNREYNSCLGVQSDNVPYELDPVHMQTVSAPLRLFAQSDMVLGEYGTAVWIDTQTEEYFMRAGSGQRLAGRVLDAVALDDPEGHTYTSAASVYNYHEGDGWNKLAIDEGHSRIAISMADGKISVLEFA